MRKWIAVLATIAVGVLCVAVPQVAVAQKSKEQKQAAKAAEKLAKIDQAEEETLALLLEESPEAKALLEQSYGHAVFDSRKMALLLKSGSGSGVAVDGDTGERHYMRMASLGAGVGVGVEVYQVVFLFEDKARFDEFVEDGWAMDATASAAAGEDSASSHATATDTDTAGTATGRRSAYTAGIAVFRFSEKGLMASADISGTKYWRDKKLNQN